MGRSISARKRAMHGPDEAPVARVRSGRGAARMRRHRSLKRQGGVAVNFVVGADAVRSLIELGWLDPARRSDREAVTGAIVALATRALALRLRPAG
jgi:hypothetical protein